MTKTIVFIFTSFLSFTALGKCPNMQTKAEKIAKSIEALENGDEKVKINVKKASFNEFTFTIPTKVAANTYAGESTFRITIEDSSMCSLISVVNEGGLE